MFLKNLTEIEITEILGMVVWLITSLWGLLGDWLTKGACPRHWRKKCSSGFVIRLHGIGDLQSQIIHSKRVLRIWDPPLTPDGLQIRQSTGLTMVGTGTPWRVEPVPKWLRKLLAPCRGERLKSITSRPLPKGREWGRGEKGQKTKDSLQLTIYLSEQIN